jgi:alpha-mannosidase
LKPGVKKEFPTDDFPSSFFTQDISLYTGLDRIDFKTAVDWWEDHTMLKVAFPLTVADRAATYEIPYGSIRRSTGVTERFERAKTEVAAEHWADLSQDDYGVALLNRAKYGYEIKGQVMKLSLLRSPTFPDPLADRGKHSIDYALYPHQGRVETSRTVARGYEYNNPLIAVLATPHKGNMPATRSLVGLEPANLVLTTMKKAEDSNAWIIQWYDAQGVDSQARLTLPRSPRKVVQSDFLEADGAPLTVHGAEVTIPTKKHSVVTVKVYFPDAR